MATTGPRLEIRLLGAFHVTLDGRRAPCGGAKRDALLAILAMNRGRPVSMDALVEYLWSTDVPAAPRNAVHHHITRLRAALGQESILGSSNGYALGDATTDALVFEEMLVEARAALRDGDAREAADLAARSLALWHGLALQGLPETDWIRAEAGRLEELRIDAHEELFEAELELGRHREIVSELQRAVRESPFRERLWRQLMLALYRSGRAADALETYQSARRVYMELGLEPSPDLRRMQQAILAHDPAIAGLLGTLRAAAPVPLEDARDELAHTLQLLREKLRHAEELYERAFPALVGIAA